MSLIWVDSFDYTTNATYFLARYDSWFSTVGTTSSGRNGRGLFDTTNANPCIRKNLPAHNTYYVGFAFNPGTNNLASNKQYIMVAFLDGSTTTAQVSLRIDSNNKLCVYRGTTLLGSGTTVLSQGSWYYIEIKVVFHSSAGTVDVRINEGTEIALTSQNTAPSGNNQAVTLQICNGNNPDSSDYNLACTYDDLYVLDDQGSVNNNFLGDVKVECLFANGNGTSSQWTNKAGNSTNNYTYVDDTTPDDDTTYVEDGTVGHIDSYTLTDLATTAVTVLGVQVSAYAKKTDAGLKSLANLVRTASTNYADSGRNLSDNYQYLSTIWEVNPNSSAAWTAAQINALEAGVKVIS